jgi:cytochrome P450
MAIRGCAAWCRRRSRRGARRAAQLRPRAEEIAAGLLDQMTAARGGVTDLMDGYARPLPITVICDLLGIPVTDRQWIAAVVAAYDKREESQRVTRELAAYFTGLIAAKRADPGDDLVSALVVARDSAGEGGAEDRLSATELLSTVFHLVMAGFDTTVNLIASGTLALLTHPGETVPGLPLFACPRIRQAAAQGRNRAR